VSVLSCLIALAHGYTVLDWYFAFSPTPPWEAMFAADTANDIARGFPFIPFGMAAILVLMLLAATSHDFWRAFLGPVLWKGAHMALYFAYAAAILHVSLGPLVAAQQPVLAIMMLGAAGFLGLGLLLGRTAVDPDGGTFDWAAGEQTLEGVTPALGRRCRRPACRRWARPGLLVRSATASVPPARCGPVGGWRIGPAPICA
jgi:hypothetical protein